MYSFLLLLIANSLLKMLSKRNEKDSSHPLFRKSLKSWGKKWVWTVSIIVSKINLPLNTRYRLQMSLVLISNFSSFRLSFGLNDIVGTCTMKQNSLSILFLFLIRYIGFGSWNSITWLKFPFIITWVNWSHSLKLISCVIPWEKKIYAWSHFFD